ncbi:hypothetical protein BV20DRAFT_828785 [Pilatotrama ljubarskyi]|nr:hypothetical protein BV20DRAFT_828785 [Pilatotrama ljubarskyi]
MSLRARHGSSNDVTLFLRVRGVRRRASSFKLEDGTSRSLYQVQRANTCTALCTVSRPKPPSGTRTWKPTADEKAGRKLSPEQDTRARMPCSMKATSLWSAELSGGASTRYMKMSQAYLVSLEHLHSVYTYPLASISTVP